MSVPGAKKWIVERPTDEYVETVQVGRRQDMAALS